MKLVIHVFPFIFTAFVIGLFADSMSHAILKLAFISRINIGDFDSCSILLVIKPAPFILFDRAILGIHHLAFSFSFAIPQLACVETSLPVLFDTMIHLAAGFIFSVLYLLLIISLFACPLPRNKSF